MDPINLNVYVIHVKVFEYRKNTCEKLRHLLEQSGHFNLNFEYITEYDPNEITPEQIRMYVSYEQLKEQHLAQFNPFIKNMHINQLSNALKHCEACKRIASQPDNKAFNIVVEDDVIFNDNIAETLKLSLESIPEDGELIFLGLPGSKEIKESIIQHQPLAEVFTILPCCDSYLLNREVASRIVKSYLPIRFSNNVHLSYLIAQHNLKCFLNVPNIFLDGSKLGLFFSSLEVNNRLIFNQDYVQLSKAINDKAEFSKEDIEIINSMFQNVKLKTNPEFYFLKAQFETKKKNYNLAKEIFQYTYTLYERNGCIMNNQSHFLREYMKLYKHLQTI